MKEASNIELKLAKTGVKYLNEAASLYDIAIEYESNGHGKISFSEKLSQKTSSLLAYCMSSKDVLSLELLSAYISLFNPTVGDSITVLLATECSLKYLNYSIQDFYTLFEPLKFTYGKLVVKNKDEFICNEDETRLVKPIELQTYVDSIVNESNGKEIKSFSRCFVRPSGTENAIRVYSEAVDIDEAKRVLNLIEEYIIKHYS